MLDSYQYDDGCEPCGNDSFSREPAVVKFSSPFTRECPAQPFPRHLESCLVLQPTPFVLWSYIGVT